MRSPNTDRRKLLLYGGLAALLLAAIGIGIVFMCQRHRGPGSPAEPGMEYNAGGPSRANLRSVDRLVERVKEDTPVSLVRFETVLRTERQPANGTPASVPATREWGYIGLSGAMIDVIQVEGTFSLLRQLHLQGPTWGPMKEDIHVGRIEWGGDPKYHCWRPLLAVRTEQPSLLLLAVSSPYTNRVTDSCCFVGPLTAGDVAWLPQFIQTLLGEPLDRMSLERARDLARSTNPWIVCLALYQLKSLDKLTATDFVPALAARAPEDAEKVLHDLFDLQGVYKGVRGDLTAALAAMIRLPERQTAVLRFLTNCIPRDLGGVRTWTDLEALQKSAREYRASLPDDPAHRELLSQLDRLIAPPL